MHILVHQILVNSEEVRNFQRRGLVGAYTTRVLI